MIRYDVQVLRRVWPLAIAVLLACSDTTEPTGPGTVTVVQGQDGQGVVATMLLPAIEVRDDGGSPVAGVRATFVVTAGGGWVASDTARTDATGRVSMSWYLGPRPGNQTLAITTSAGSVEVRATALPLQAGQTYLGANGWMELIAGDLPVILSAPHGGTIQPAAIPDRTGADVTTVRDSNTEELARAISAQFLARTGRGPFVIICRLHRLKLDANREIVEAAKGNALAERAWREYHGFIEAARARVIDTYATGFYVDLHGHGHDIERLELGYLLTSTELEGSDASLNATSLVTKSSIRSLVQTSGQSHAALLRGPKSLGALFETHGFRSVPGPIDADPGNQPYFNGGYNTARYGSRDGSAVSGVQIESQFTGVRNTAASRDTFAAAFVNVFDEYFRTFYGTSLIPALASGTAAR